MLIHLAENEEQRRIGRDLRGEPVVESTAGMIIRGGRNSGSSYKRSGLINATSWLVVVDFDDYFLGQSVPEVDTLLSPAVGVTIVQHANLDEVPVVVGVLTFVESSEVAKGNKGLRDSPGISRTDWSVARSGKA